MFHFYKSVIKSFACIKYRRKKIISHGLTQIKNKNKTESEAYTNDEERVNPLILINWLKMKNFTLIKR